MPKFDAPNPRYLALSIGLIQPEQFKIDADTERKIKFVTQPANLITLAAISSCLSKDFNPELDEQSQSPDIPIVVKNLVKKMLTENVYPDEIQTIERTFKQKISQQLNRELNDDLVASSQLTDNNIDSLYIGSLLSPTVKILWNSFNLTDKDINTSNILKDIEEQPEMLDQIWKNLVNNLHTSIKKNFERIKLQAETRKNDEARSLAFAETLQERVDPNLERFTSNLPGEEKKYFFLLNHPALSDARFTPDNLLQLLDTEVVTSQKDLTYPKKNIQTLIDIRRNKEGLRRTREGICKKIESVQDKARFMFEAATIISYDPKFIQEIAEKHIWPIFEGITQEHPLLKLIELPAPWKRILKDRLTTDIKDTPENNMKILELIFESIATGDKELCDQISMDFSAVQQDKTFDQLIAYGSSIKKDDQTLKYSILFDPKDNFQALATSYLLENNPDERKKFIISMKKQIDRVSRRKTLPERLKVRREKIVQENHQIYLTFMSTIVDSVRKDHISIMTQDLQESGYEGEKLKNILENSIRSTYNAIVADSQESSSNNFKRRLPVSNLVESQVVELIRQNLKFHKNDTLESLTRRVALSFMSHNYRA